MKLTPPVRVVLLLCALFAFAPSISCGNEAKAGTANPDCSGNWRQDERDGFLALNLGPCFVFRADVNTPQQHGLEFSYTLQRPLHVANIYGWVGTGEGTRIEVGNRLLIDVPPNAEHTQGLHREFEIQYDKHQDVVGNKAPAPWPVNMTLPVGTTMTVQRTEFLKSCPDSGCTIEFRWVLQDNI